MGNNNRLTFWLKGINDDDGYVRLNELIEFIQSVLISLRRVEFCISGQERPSVYYRIVELKSSDPTITIEPVSLRARDNIIEKIMPSYKNAITRIQNEGLLPDNFNPSYLEDFKGLVKPLKRHVASIGMKWNGTSFEITNQLNTNINKILGEDITSVGSLTGYLDLLNVHKGNKFFIYPVIGPQKVECFFENELLEKVKEGIKRYVNVHGTLYYRSKDPYPFKVKVEEIEIYPPESELPKLMDLKGIAPNLTGGKSSVEYVREQRDIEE